MVPRSRSTLGRSGTAQHSIRLVTIEQNKFEWTTNSEKKVQEQEKGVRAASCYGDSLIDRQHLRTYLPSSDLFVKRAHIR